MWLSTDPALPEYLPTAKQVYFPEEAFNAKNLKGAGGVFNSVNANIYHYAGQNPLKFIDPDGQAIIFLVIAVIILEELMNAEPTGCGEGEYCARNSDGEPDARGVLPLMSNALPSPGKAKRGLKFAQNQIQRQLKKNLVHQVKDNISEIKKLKKLMKRGELNPKEYAEKVHELKSKTKEQIMDLRKRAEPLNDKEQQKEILQKIKELEDQLKDL